MRETLRHPTGNQKVVGLMLQRDCVVNAIGSQAAKAPDHCAPSPFDPLRSLRACIERVLRLLRFDKLSVALRMTPLRSR